MAEDQGRAIGFEKEGSGGGGLSVVRQDHMRSGLGESQDWGGLVRFDQLGSKAARVGRESGLEVRERNGRYDGIFVLI